MTGRPALPASRTARLLWLAVAMVAAALAAVALVSTVRAGDEEPSETARYISAVNRVVVTSGSQVGEVNRSYRRFREDPGSVEVTELERAERSLRAVRARIAAVPAVSVAVDLRRALLRSLDGQVAFAHEVALLAGYLPVAAGVETDLAAATNRLRRDVRAATTAEAQSTAFDGYARRVAALVERLRAAEPPSSFAGAREAEADRIEALRSSAASLADGLRSARVASVNRALERFTAATAGSRVADERRRAIRLYDRRLRALARLQARVETERRSLEAAGA